MFGLKTISRHADLTTRMASALGRDPSRSMISSPTGAERWRGAVLSCTACTQAEACGKWLETHDHADQPPAYCRGRAYFAGLPKEAEPA
ncbi:DUF6455 family protein [Histidinibacterium aquaticum]|uniref:DUF6455 domain-containing protein n=1 Tax=Histidinibacterium aquaticum TaxID=2613962 RepID=A0A5J5GID9_9RHOB|nr:DUF6455 family protein [Histidinibacterium aquaticum]KAA9007996.1 hypothetical protein F3S47_10820 [Histidinibacterium aquaticum]